MRNIMIIAMLFICCSVNAVIYTFVTNSGTFIINERTNTISFKGTTYQIFLANGCSVFCQCPCFHIGKY